MNARKAQFVFGYGSLTARPGPVPTRELKEHGFVADLTGLRRAWGVAMDNRHDLPGYKYSSRTGLKISKALTGLSSAITLWRTLPGMRY